MLRKLQTSRDETAIVRQERDMLKEKVNEERARCNILEGQLAEKQNLCSDLLRKCKTNHFETELYKALDLAHDYQEKCKQLESEKKQLQQTFEKDLLEKDDVINSKQKDLDLMKENYDAVMRLNKQSTECVKNVDEALEKERNEHEITRSKLTEMLRKLQTSQDETAIVRQERDMLKEKVNEERARCNILEGQLAEKQNLCSDLLRKCMAKLVLLLVLIAAIGFGAWKLSCCWHPPHPPHLDSNEWWGPAQLKGRVDTAVQPFKIQFSEEMIKDLRSRLNNHRPLTPPLEGIDMQYGMNSDQLEKILKYWSQDYPFQKREEFLNQFPQYKTNIQGLDIHFIRVKPEAKPGVKVLPLLLLHGWPGSVREFYEAIPILTKQRPGYDFVFEVVVPSLPGYGFSSPAVRPGLGPAHIGVIMRNLMQRLGYKKFYVQGGDWGSAIGSSMSTIYPEDVLGFHSNMGFSMGKCAALRTFFGSFVPSLVVEEKLADRMYPLSSLFSYVMEEFGYMHLQATKPDTVGVGVSDSPAGLAAYILEKFASWTIRGAKTIPSHLSKEGLIDNLMFYWVPNSVTTSMRLYAEAMSSKYRAMKMDDIQSPVPTWIAQAKHELAFQPANILRTKFVNLLDTTVLDEGGHFLAFELPKVLSDDVFKAVKAFRAWHDQRNKEKTEL